MRAAIIISGSRRLREPAHRNAIWNYVSRFGGGYEHVIVLHGAQTGADDIADGYARKLEFSVLGVPYFELEGKEARNECVIDIGIRLARDGIYTLHMGAFPDSGSVGTWKAVRYAKSRNVVAEVMKQ